MYRNLVPFFSLILFLSVGCTTYKSRIDNSEGAPPVYEDTSSSGKVSGVGVESRDIVAMTSEMVQDLLASPVISGRKTPPRIILDSQHLKNEGSTRINKNLITTRMLVGLNRAAGGSIVFVDREAAGMIEKERSLKRTGVVDLGTIRKTEATLGADFRLNGRIMTLDATAQNGMQSRFHQIVFKMIDLESGAVVWSNLYEFKKSSQGNVVYR